MIGACGACGNAREECECNQCVTRTRLTFPQRRWGDIAKRQFPQAACYADDARERSERYVALACESIAAFERGRHEHGPISECDACGIFYRCHMHK